VGESSKWNISMILHNAVTNQVAELGAGIMGLKRAREIWESGEMDEIYEDGELRKEPRHVINKADSEYLVKGMTEWIFQWEKNGFTNVKGTEVVNRKLFEQCQTEVKGLKERGVMVQFWHIKRKWNREADGMANVALDEN
jgi:ribonuclease HI